MPTSEVVYGHAGRIVRAPWRGNAHTLLQHLRDERRLTGTKEGCAEGDCGACMVLIGEPAADGQGVSFRSANACLQPLSGVHGRLVVTVEDVGRPDALHPVQQAMVDEHASQCGFCTPGFVVSLYEHYLDHAEPTDTEAVHRRLSGNLCRCTGYASILRAARAMHALPRVARDAAADLALIDRVQKEASSAGQDLARGPYTAHLPGDAGQVARLLEQHPAARLLGGSTDAGLWITKRLDQPLRTIHLARAADLRVIRRDADGLALGAALSLTDAFRALVVDHPELDEYLARFASPSVRHWGTLGGNIANGSPVGDSMPVLLALDAQLLLRRSDARRTLPLDAFYLGYQRNALQPAEFIEAVQVPPRPPQTFVRAYKISKRHDDDISAVSLAIAVQVDAGRVVRARVAMGGMAEVPRRAGKVEAALTGKAFDPASFDEVADALAADVSPISDHRASARYRARVAANLIRRAMLEYSGESHPRVVRIVKEPA